MGGDEDDGCTFAYGSQPLSELDARHPAELNVEDEATELWMLSVGKKRFRRIVSNRLHSRGAQKPTKRSANVFVVIHNCNVDRGGAAHGDSMSTVGAERKRVYCPLGKVGAAPEDAGLLRER